MLMHVIDLKLPLGVVINTICLKVGHFTHEVDLRAMAISLVANLTIQCPPPKAKAHSKNPKPHNRKPQILATNKFNVSAQCPIIYMDLKLHLWILARTFSYLPHHCVPLVLAPNYTHISAKKFKYTIPSTNKPYLKVTIIMRSSNVTWWNTTTMQSNVYQIWSEDNGDC